MFSDFGYIFVWWLALFGIGLVFLPLTKKLFANFFDEGYLFSKVLGILFSSYLVWLLASLKILPFHKDTIWLVITIGLLVNLVLFFRKSKTSTLIPHPQPTSHFSPTLLIFILEELIFLLTLVFWSFIRGFQPNIQGLEKFMDFGFVNSILRSKFFPPADMWFAGEPINYYYFGHFVTAFLTKLTGIDPAISYNLMIATLFAFTFSLTFSLTGNLIYLFRHHWKLIILGGLASALLISLGANLHPAYYNFKMGILKKPYCDGAFFYWYPNATRYIGYCPNVEDKTIHEFPSYSFIVSDLHGHVIDIPFVLLFLALTFNLFNLLREKSPKVLSFVYPVREFLILSLPISLTLAVMFMTNQWDFPIYLMILGFVLLIAYFQNFGFVWRTLVKAITLGGAILLLSIPFLLPFQLNFKPIVQGIAFVRAHSLPHQLLILWGAPWFFGLTFLLFLFGRRLKTKQIFKKENLIKWLSKILGVGIELKSPESPPPTIDRPTRQPLITDFFVLILFAVATLLVIIPEIIYVKDIYISSYHRANTMFKLTYQSFIMFSIGTGYIIIRLLSSLRKSLIKNIFFIFSFLFFICLIFYPFYSIRGYYGDLRRQNYKGLYGLKFLQTAYPDDYRAILWLNKNIKGQPVVLEAVGDSYTDYERISMATGLPTIEGWLVHEWLWRGGFDGPGKRSSEVQTIYESKDSNQTKILLQKYKVKYLILGQMEKEKYPNLYTKKFDSLGKKVFESGRTVIFELF